jgi:predicted negative regulator of RcsB-dependent stress response
MKLFILILIAFLCPFGWIYINRLDSKSYSDETSYDYKNFIGNSSYSDETSYDYKNFQFSNSNKFDIIYINLIIFFIHFI